MQDYFETIKCDDSEVYHLSYHNKRISNTVSLNLNLSEYIYAPNNKLLKCKVIYNEEGIKEVTYTEYKKREISTFKLIFYDTIEYYKKNLDREDLD